MRRLPFLAATLLILMGTTTAPATAASTVEVAILGNTSPFYGAGSCSNPGGNVITISAGDSVVWTNCDSVVHTASGQSFTTGDLYEGQSSSPIQFNAPGRYDYVSLSPAANTMRGTVFVVAAADPVPPAPATTATPRATTSTTSEVSTTSTSTTDTTLTTLALSSPSVSTTTTTTVVKPDLAARRWRHWRHRIKRLGIALFVLVAFLLVIGAVFGTVAFLFLRARTPR